MNPVLKKLGYSGQSPILIVNPPDQYTPVMDEMSGEIHAVIRDNYKFIQIFAEKMSDAVRYCEETIQALDGDGYFWLCYPKSTSKKYRSDINRAKAMVVLAPYEYEPVTQIAVDEDWSAMRFRHVDYIKQMKRKTAVTEKGKERINK